FNKITLAVFPVALLLMVGGPSFAHATLYQPGATLNPDCAPGSPNCGVMSLTALNNGTGYVASWTSSSTLSSGIILDNGTVAGVNATFSSYTFNLQGSSGVSPFNIASSTGTSLLSVNQAGHVGIGPSSAN